MSVDQNTIDALDLAALQFPSSLNIQSIEAEDYTDSTGEPSLKILVVLDEATDLGRVSGEDVGELKSIIRDSLRRHGVVVFPYIFLAKPSELADSDDEE